MKILLDENLPHDLQELLAPPHTVSTVSHEGWKGIANGALLARAGAAGLDVLITMDSGIPYQQNTLTLACSFVVLKAKSNRIADLQPLVPQLLDTLMNLAPRSFAVVG